MSLSASMMVPLSLAEVTALILPEGIPSSVRVLFSRDLIWVRFRCECFEFLRQARANCLALMPSWAANNGLA